MGLAGCILLRCVKMARITPARLWPHGRPPEVGGEPPAAHQTGQRQAEQSGWAKRCPNPQQLSSGAQQLCSQPRRFSRLRCLPSQVALTSHNHMPRAELGERLAGRGLRDGPPEKGLLRPPLDVTGTDSHRGRSAQGADWSLHQSLSFVQSLSSSVPPEKAGGLPCNPLLADEGPSHPHPSQESRGAPDTKPCFLLVGL